MLRDACIVLVAVLIGGAAQSASALDNELVGHAEAALEKCTRYLVDEVAYQGGYVGTYLEDLSDQWGEAHCLRHQSWLQPPGSPSTGQAFLAAWRATGKQVYLDAAVANARSLVWGQLECGGWVYVVDYTREGEERNYYRHNAGSDDQKLKSGANRGTYDDDTSQASLRMLMATDEALDGQDASIHEAAMAGLEWVLKSQYAHGGFPQWYPLSATGYSRHSTYNDGNMYNIMYLLMAAYEQYGDERYQRTLLRLGDFFINSQLPEPQPIWAQQYDEDMRPAWARMFEPASVTGGETSGVMTALIEMAVYTKDPKYLAPIPSALEWYKRSQLPNGRWARFYELKTNKPLYFTSDNRTTYRLIYDDSDMPDHYSFNASSYPQRVEDAYKAITGQGLEAHAAARRPKQLTPAALTTRAEEMEEAVRNTLSEQTDKGVWVKTSGEQRIIDMGLVQRQMRTLSSYLAAANGNQ